MNKMKKLCLALISVNLVGAAMADVMPKPATEFTREANRKVLAELPFDDTRDFVDASRGFIARPDFMQIKDGKGNVVWDMESYKRFISSNKSAPDTVNPSLWRNAQLNMEYGLYKVADHIYQIRGFDLSNATFIEGKTGWIVFDTLLSQETGKAALDFINKTLGERPVVAVVYSHPHADHYGGVRGMVSEADVLSGKVPIIAPEHFSEHAIKENVIAGNAMSRRAVYMYGAMLERGERGSINAGLGQTISSGQVSLLLPTHEIKQSIEEMEIDGVKMVFQLTPGTEAPAEMNTWFPQFKALWMAENVTNTMHNLLTLRGAEVRDPIKWSDGLNTTIETWGDQVQVRFQSHHWPSWGNANIVDGLKKQRDLYKYIHDQSVRMLNQGMTGEEISETIQLPPSLSHYWPNRGYYGTLRHNSRAVYQRYMGWYDGNPSSLNNEPPEMVAPKYVQFMGGEDTVLKKAAESYQKGDYRWVAEVLKHVVFANPKNQPAKELLADAYEQLGYQAESGPWRSIYLQGASELRKGLPTGSATKSSSPDTIREMTPDMLFDYLAVRLLPQKAEGRTLSLNVHFPDIGVHRGLSLENSVLNHSRKLNSKADADITLSKTTLNAILLREITLEEAIAQRKIRITGEQQALPQLMAMMDTFQFWFPIVTP